MPDLVPHALRRILLLRHFPLLGTAELGDLALVAENLIDTLFPPGATIARSGARASAVHLIISGEVVRSGRDPLGAGSVIGALEVFAKRALSSTAVAAAETRTLQLNASDIHELLEDNFGLMRATVRDLAARLVRVPPEDGEPLPGGFAGPLGLVERLMLLRSQPAFANVRLEALAALAHNSEEIRWHAGTVIARAGEQATGAYIVAAGEVRSGDGHRLGPGHAIGPLETLGELRYANTVVAATEARALACSATTIFDVVEDHADFGMAMIASFADALLAAPRRTVN